MCTNRLGSAWLQSDSIRLLPMLDADLLSLVWYCLNPMAKKGCWFCDVRCTWWVIFSPNEAWSVRLCLQGGSRHADNAAMILLPPHTKTCQTRPNAMLNETRLLLLTCQSGHKQGPAYPSPHLLSAPAAWTPPRQKRDGRWSRPESPHRLLMVPERRNRF